MKTNQKIGIVISFIVLNILLISFITSLSISNTSINPINATSSQNLYCSWNITGYETYNITWYNNSIVFNSSTSIISPWGLSYLHTTKGDDWNCTIFAINNSNIPTNTSQSDIITIKNSPPLTPYVTNSSGVDIESYEEIYEGIEYTFNLISNDVDSDTLTYYKILISGNDICSINSNTGVITCNASSEPTTSANDRYRFFADDGENGVSKTLNINVTPINDAPTFSTAISDSSINENETLSYSITVTDEEYSNGPFKFTVNSTYNPERIINTTSDNKTFILQFIGNRKSNFSDVGNNTITVKACDPINSTLCVSDYFELEVITINHNPQFTNLQNKSGSQNQNFIMYLNATDTDAADTLNFSINSLDCGRNIWNLTILKNDYNNASALINVTLSNTHILCKNITVSVTDSKGIISQNLYLNLSNVNDAPMLYNLSYYNANSNNNVDIRYLTAYTGASFLYKINGTDIDIGIDANELLTYTDNSSLCNGNCPTLSLNQNTGIITFMPNNTLTNNYYYNVTIFDNYGNFVETFMNITIYNNSVPFFNISPSNQTAFEDTLFSYDLDVTDPEGSFDSFLDNSPLFDISSTGLISFTKNCSFIGNHTVTIIINDTLSAINTSTFNIEIIPTNDSPVLPVVYNVTSFEEFYYTIDIASQTSDEDISCSQADTLIFTSEFTFGNTIFNISSNGIIAFTPNSTNQGSYLINITVIDSYGLTDSLIWNLTIINRSSAPVIHNITPHSIPLNTSWKDASDFSNSLTNTNSSENITILFDHNSTDDDLDDLFYNWTENGIVIGHNKNYSRYFDFNDNGVFNITLKVSDNVSGMLAHYTAFTWNLTINNLNRLPLLNSSLPNVTNLTTQYRWSNYLIGGGGNVRFNDQDNDSLTYNNSATSKVSISYDGTDVIFTPIEIGIEYVIFSAFDGTNRIYSNNVTINITGIPNATDSSTTTIITISNSGSNSDATYIPFSVIQEVEIEREVFLDILNPEPAILYNNNSLRQVISIINNGNKTLKGIYLSAITNSSTAKIMFSQSYIPELLIGQRLKTDLIVEDYKLYNNYEIIIYANVTDPVYKDKAVIYINALEKSRGNQSVTSTKITFAHDLLNSNPECLELNEYLKKALAKMNSHDYTEAAKIVDAVIQGCKYLVSQSKLKNEQPNGLFINLEVFKKVPFLLPVVILFAILLVFVTVLTIRAKKLADDEEKDE